MTLTPEREQRMKEIRAAMPIELTSTGADPEMGPLGTRTAYVMIRAADRDWLQAELEAATTLLDALRSETQHPKYGMIAIRPCIKCGEPYPEWTVVSRMTCADCRLRGEAKALVDLEAATHENERLREAISEQVRMYGGDYGGREMSAALASPAPETP